MGGKVNSTALIIGSAPWESQSNLDRYHEAGMYTIAADGGRISAEHAGISVDWYVGDGDSGGSLSGLSGKILPEQKDVTDLEAAVEHALERDISRIIMWGVSGGRADHHLANVQLLERIAEQGGNGLFLDEINEIRFLSPGCFCIPNSPSYRYLGIIPLDASLQDVSIQGTKYTLQHATVQRGSTLTVSNEILDGRNAQITIGGGAALLVRSVPIFPAH